MYSMFHDNMQIEIYIYYNMNYNQRIHKEILFLLK